MTDTEGQNPNFNELVDSMKVSKPDSGGLLKKAEELNQPAANVDTHQVAATDTNRQMGEQALRDMTGK